MTSGRGNGRYLVVGGAGFLGSHFVERLLSEGATKAVRVYDNFSSGQDWHLDPHRGNKRLDVIRADVHDLDRLIEATKGFDTVIHLASNPDIARAATDPDIDFAEGTELTRNVLEAMRRADSRTILYASGSGVYGDLGDTEGVEQVVDIRPLSTYGASKLAGEGLISAYCHMFDMNGYCFRFGNVVGRRQTHGIGYDFVRKLLADPTTLDILGDGSQSKSYIHAEDTVAAVVHVFQNAPQAYDVFNVATGDYITVTEIAELAVECLGLNRDDVSLQYAGGRRGWKGDIPVVRLNTEKIRALGWRNRYSSAEAMRAALAALLQDARVPAA